MGKPTGFLDYARMDCPARSAGARVADWAPLDLPLSEKTAAGSPAAAWTAACPSARPA
ncbi:MAG: hypothetical protein ACLUFI_14125 [Oscillospiraceae bacterium]